MQISDAAPLLEDICFEAAYAMAGQTFILSAPEQLDGLYDQINASGQCPRPIERHSFDFKGRAIVGTWTYAAEGCTARHDPVRLRRSAENRVLTLRYRFVVEGECPYELIRPLWIAVENPEGYDIRLIFAD